MNLRLRALVMPTLAVACFGGRTFEHDNHMVDDVTTSTVTLHGGKFAIKGSSYTLPRAHPPPQLTTDSLTKAQPPPQLTIDDFQSRLQQLAAIRAPFKPGGESEKNLTKEEVAPNRTLEGDLDSAKQVKEEETRQEAKGEEIKPVLMKNAAKLLPQGVYPIPCNLQSNQKVLVMPPTPLELPPGTTRWPAQVCDVAFNSALYVNHSDKPLLHGKNTHFRLLPMHQTEIEKPKSCPVNLLTLKNDASHTDVLSQIKINRDILTPAQSKRLDSLHREHQTAFNEDMSDGFQDHANPYYATFSFKEENRAPPYKVWSPKFNRKCQDLLQAKCDELEVDNIMADPSKLGIDVRHVSPCMIQQKARAKHKPLEQCSLDELRFITCFNALNDSIHPVPGRSFVFNDILKFLARHKFTIYADLASSYFQIKIDRKLWKYLGVMTPYRGIRVLTRLGQGLVNSDNHLEQVVTRVLGDEMLAGKCLIARDDLIVGGNSVDECIDNWCLILGKLDKYNLKLSPKKVRILLPDAEIYGHHIRDGKIRPSDHNVSTLAATTPDALVTVKQVNSWKGLYKTLIRHLPHLAKYMAPFDAACAGQASAEKFDWSKPGILAAFNAATKQLDKIMETFLPNPQEQLALLPDTSDINLCTGWVLYTKRQFPEGPRWLPVQYASAKLSPYMARWSPCEKEGVGAVLAIEQVRHWINESLLPTLVLPDNKPVVEAADLMRMGRHSKDPRLQSLLACVNRSNIVFRHNSAKAGLHIVPDALSRAPVKSCNSSDCQIHRFLSDLPARIACMPMSLETIAMASTDPAIMAAMGPEMQLLGKGTGPIPLGSRQTWISLQADCPDCVQFLQCKRLGEVPGRKDRNKAVINRLLKQCEVVNGLIVSKSFDSTLMKETDRIYVPSAFLEAILTVMHVRLEHPAPTQLQRIFEKYFLGFNVHNLCETISNSCSLCVANKRFPKELDTYSPSEGPLHPGSHMNLDLMRRAGQYVVVNCDRFSNFATATLVDNETRDMLVAAILSVVTPIRHAAQVEVRTDRATALQSLANRPHKQLEENGITVVLGDHANKNSNCSVDKTIQELEEELKKIDPESRKLTSGELCRAVTNLNNRIRGHGLSASQVHFSRDQHTGQNLNLRDTTFQELRQARQGHNPSAAKSKAPAAAKPHQPSIFKPGDITYIKGEGTKHTSRDPLVVTKVEGDQLTVQKMLRSTPNHEGAPRITSQKLVVQEKFLAPPLSKRPTGHDLHSGVKASPIKPRQLSRSSLSKNWRDDMHSAAPKAIPRAKSSIKLTPPWRPIAISPDEDLVETVYIQDVEAVEHQLNQAQHQIYHPPRRHQIHAALIGNRVNWDRPQDQAHNEEGGGEQQEQDQADDEEVHVEQGEGAQQDEQDVEALQQQGGEQGQHLLEEAIQAQLAQPDISRGGRPRKTPDWYGIEKPRLTAMEEDKVAQISAPPSRDITPLSSPNLSPDTSLNTGHQEGDVLSRHRHFSIDAKETEEKHPYCMMDWIPDHVQMPNSNPPNQDKGGRSNSC